MTTATKACIFSTGGGVLLVVLGNRIGRELAAPFAAGATLLLGSLANFLTHNSYPLLRVEVGILAGAILLVCVALAFFYRPQRQWGRSVLEGFLAALFVDLNSNSLLAMLAIGFGLAVFTYWRRISLLGPMAVLGGVVLLTTLVGLGGRDSWITSTTTKPAAGSAQLSGARPAIVHLILDEHIGIEGLPNDEVAQALKSDLKGFYSGQGFALYGGAYSEHLHTVNAIPNILNYGRKLAQAASTDGVEIGKTEHLQGLVERGYRLVIFQSDFADFCSGSAEQECWTYDSSSLQPTLAMPLTVVDRAALSGSKFLSLSAIFDRLAMAWNMTAIRSRRLGIPLGFVTTESASKSSTVGTLAAFASLEGRLRRAKPGEAIFAHLLVPHYPYVVDKNCQPLGWAAWEHRRSNAPHKVRSDAYYGQVRCLTVRLRRLLHALEQSPAGKNAIVIFHGDHGSRITRIDPNEPSRGKFGEADVNAGFSTLFAVRGPGIQPAYTSAPQPASSLLRAFAEGDFKMAPPTNQPLRPLILDDWEWKPRGTMPIPDSWIKRVDRPATGQ